MSKVLESLKKYFEETPKEQLDKDFKEIDNKWGHIGPTVEEWLESNFKSNFMIHFKYSDKANQYVF